MRKKNEGPDVALAIHVQEKDSFDGFETWAHKQGRVCGCGRPRFFEIAHVCVHVHGGRPGEVIPNNKFRKVSILQKNKEVQRTEFSLTSDMLSLLRV